EARSGQGNLFPGLSYCLSNSTPEFREKFPLAARNLEKICKKDSCEVSFSLPKDATFFRIALSEIRDDEERIY
ncbi:hypothetical protein KY304_01815, partial [Candidatus Woesearchaeota archaeon]|nr:hypothetical protein [Candidatus Woesearchaeota archaeon]